MTDLAQDQLIRKEVALGVARELPLDQNYIWSSIAPFMPVQSDDVIFRYAKPTVEPLAPARAEDAESELAQKDDFFGSGRASIVDWAVRDGYSASDVTRYREYMRLAELTQGQAFPMSIGNMTEDWQAQLSRDSVERRRKLERRLEWLTTQALSNSTGIIAYDDGKVDFSVDYGRPANQTDEAPASTIEWNVGDGTHDPIGDMQAVVDFMFDTHKIDMRTVIMSRKALRYMGDSGKFYPRLGLSTPAGATRKDIGYVEPSFSIEVARNIIEQYTGLNVVVYEAQYRTRPIGSQTFTANRFIPEPQVIFLPDQASASELIGTELGFGKTMTSPHAESNFQTGFYTWEKNSVDPWRYSLGTGVKAFPVFPAMELTYTMTAWT